MLNYLEKRKVWLIYIPLAVYWLFLLIATSIPANNLPSLGVSDKLYHLGAYTVLSVLIKLTFIFQRKSKFFFDNATAASIIIASFYGALDEIHQIYVPGRNAELLDWSADVLGACLGSLIVSYLIKKFEYSLKFD